VARSGKRPIHHHLRSGDDAGGAIVEFLGVSLLLLVPLVYLILALGRIQAGTYAAEAAADAASRAAVVGGVTALDQGATVPAAIAFANRRANTVVDVVLTDFAFDMDSDAVMRLSCTSTPCFSPGSDVRAEVEIEVAFPGVPALIRSWLPLTVTVSAASTSSVDGFAGGS
jgi:Flp pilus assembly protein TadG